MTFVPRFGARSELLQADISLHSVQENIARIQGVFMSGWPLTFKRWREGDGREAVGMARCGEKKGDEMVNTA